MATKKMDFFDSDDGEMVAPVKPPARKRANTAAPKKVAFVAPV